MSKATLHLPNENNVTIDELVGMLPTKSKAQTQLNSLVERIDNQHKDLYRVAEFAQCMGDPKEYADDTLYLRAIKDYVAYLSKTNEEYRQQLVKNQNHSDILAIDYAALQAENERYREALERMVYCFGYLGDYTYDSMETETLELAREALSDSDTLKG
jgi:hypothetical protein